jgi:hypothetical protein
MAGLKGRRRENHGMYKSPEYINWRGMNERCRNAASAHYDRYGGRGIRVCQEWQDSFTAFYNYLGPRPSPGMTIERIDNDGNYEPGNVRWATRKEQTANRNIKRHDFYGQELTVLEIASHIDVDRQVVDKLLAKGHAIEEIAEDIVFGLRRLHNPKEEGFVAHQRFITYEGETFTLREFCNKYGTSYSKLHKLLYRRGLSDKEAGDILLGVTADPVHPTVHEGEVYGMLTVVDTRREMVNGKPRVLCDCTCGNRNISVVEYDLRYGSRTHCGCMSGRNRVAGRKK